MEFKLREVVNGNEQDIGLNSSPVMFDSDLARIEVWTDDKNEVGVFTLKLYA